MNKVRAGRPEAGTVNTVIVKDASRYLIMFLDQLINFDVIVLLFIFSFKLFTHNIILIHFINFLDQPNDPKYIQIALLVNIFILSATT